MYTDPGQFEPLLPQKDLAPLAEEAKAIVAGSLELASCAHESARAELRELVRGMNSYYSNRIEGQSTHPRNIERALKHDFSDKPDVARLQRIALAHIEAEKELESKATAGAMPLLSSFAIEAHRAMYGRLSEADRTTSEKVIVEPGAIRDTDVEVGRHVPPVWSSIPRFLARLDAVYGRMSGPDDLLIKAACAHQRLAWVHPFVDGNGRAARLQTHCALLPVSFGLWSANRGLARRRDEYYARLAEADEPRRGDLDGRGNLSEEGLRRWVAFFLELCRDQVEFMAGLFELQGMKRRIEALIVFRSSQDKAYRSEAILPLFHLFAAGPLTRSEFQQMTGLGERVARKLLSHLLKSGLVKTDTPLGVVRFGLPLDGLQFLLPDLYPEAAGRGDR